METKTAFQIIDSVTVKLWNRLADYHNWVEEARAVYDAYLACAISRDAVAERDGIVWSDTHGWTTPEMREETV